MISANQGPSQRPPFLTAGRLPMAAAIFLVAALVPPFPLLTARTSGTRTSGFGTKAGSSRAAPG